MQTASESSSSSSACSACSGGRDDAQVDHAGEPTRARARTGRARAGRRRRGRRRLRVGSDGDADLDLGVVQFLLQAGIATIARQSQMRGRGRVRAVPVPSDPTPTFPEHMFPSLTTRRDRPRPLRELVRGALGTALEFATLGEATLAPHGLTRRPHRPRVAGRGVHRPHAAHPHRRRLTRQQRARRPGMVRRAHPGLPPPVHRPAHRRA